MSKEENKNPDEKVDQGARYASHWTKQENKNKPVDLAEIEKVREERKKHYHEIAKEYVVLVTPTRHPSETDSSAAIMISRPIISSLDGAHDSISVRFPSRVKVLMRL